MIETILPNSLKASGYALAYRWLAPNYTAGFGFSIHDALRGIAREYPEYMKAPKIAAGIAAIVAEMDFNRNVSMRVPGIVMQTTSEETARERISEEERAAIDKVTNFFSAGSPGYRSNLEERLEKMKADHSS